MCAQKQRKKYTVRHISQIVVFDSHTFTDNTQFFKYTFTFSSCFFLFGRKHFVAITSVRFVFAFNDIKKHGVSKQTRFNHNFIESFDVPITYSTTPCTKHSIAYNGEKEERKKKYGEFTFQRIKGVFVCIRRNIKCSFDCVRFDFFVFLVLLEFICFFCSHVDSICKWNMRSPNKIG